MKNASSYPFPGGSRISTREAVELIAAVVYPNQDEAIAKKRIRDRVRYAKDSERLPGTNTFDAVQFFDWALGIRPWHDALMSVKGLPCTTRSEPQAGDSKVTGFRPSVVLTPGDPETLRKEYIRIAKLCQEQASEVDSLKQLVVELEAELARWREKDRAMREQRRRAGKKGGRGNSL